MRLPIKILVAMNCTVIIFSLMMLINTIYLEYAISGFNLKNTFDYSFYVTITFFILVLVSCIINIFSHIRSKS